MIQLGNRMPIPGSDGWSVAAIRSTKGISLEQIASDTKLKISTLKAIEDGDFEALPGGIYNLSYIRQYARAIGADEGALIELYRKKCGFNPQSMAS